MYPRFNSPAQTPNTNTSKPLKFTSDSQNSTYRWEIWLTKGHGRNSDKVNVLDGYSKGIGAENPNKVELLMKKIMNPLVPYLAKSDVIVVYENHYGLPKDSHPLVLTLYRNNFVAHGWLEEDSFVNHWLKNYYNEFIKTGKMPSEEDRGKNMRQMLLHPDLEHVNHNFKSVKELADFCTQNTPRFSRACMETWYYAHQSYQPELFANDIKVAVEHAVNTSPTKEGAEKAMQAYNLANAMLNKYTGNQ